VGFMPAGFAREPARFGRGGRVFSCENLRGECGVVGGAGCAWCVSRRRFGRFRNSRRASCWSGSSSEQLEVGGVLEVREDVARESDAAVVDRREHAEPRTLREHLGVGRSSIVSRSCASPASDMLCVGTGTISSLEATMALMLRMPNAGELSISTYFRRQLNSTQGAWPSGGISSL